jgi:hypothetical protein
MGGKKYWAEAGRAIVGLYETERWRLRAPLPGEERDLTISCACLSQRRE